MYGPPLPDIVSQLCCLRWKPSSCAVGYAHHRRDKTFSGPASMPNVSSSALKTTSLSHHCEVLASTKPRILGAPVGDYLHCSRFIANKCAESKKLLSNLMDMAGVS